MRRAKVILGFFTMLLLIGAGQLIRYSEKVRFVDFLGISASVVTCGAALVGIIGCVLVFSGKLRLADKKPAEEQRSLS
jgi:hypothetical protein